LKILHTLHKSKIKKEKTFVLFIDFKNAYNKIVRSKVEDMLRSNKIFSEDEIQLWRFLCQNQII